MESALKSVRILIDGVDDAFLALLAGRRRLVSLTVRFKRHRGQMGRDLDREREVRLRAHRLGCRLGLPPSSSDHLMTTLIQDACWQQGLEEVAENEILVDLDQGNINENNEILPSVMSVTIFSKSSWLRLLPPPERLAPFLQRLPAVWQARLLEAVIQRVLMAPIVEGTLDILATRRIGIEVSDLGLRWVIALRDGRMQVCRPDAVAETTVRGTATDLLLLASRREDADTLFFQRRLVLVGDTELGLTARNLLDQLPWQQIPLGLRIALHRGAGLVQAARAAYRGEAASTQIFH